MEKFDKRRKYYMILDCETATLPFITDYNAEETKKLAIAKPLIYDIGYQIIDIKGNVYKKVNYLISEIFSVPDIFNTAYYAIKRPIYIEKLSKKEISITSWDSFVDEFEKDLQVVQAVGAYNSMFDFKKAIPFTEKYIRALYSTNYYDFLKKEKKNCEYILQNRKDYESDFDKDVFSFRDKHYLLFDVWGLACEHLLNNDDFRGFCEENKRYTASGKYYSTSAETAFQFIMGDENFVEAHCALDDAIIESEIFSKIGEKTKHKFQYGIIYFPFKIIGKVEE